MKHIAVVDCASSGQMYVDDIIRMGYRPLLINIYFDVEHAQAWNSKVEYMKRSIGDAADFVQLPKEYVMEDILEQLKGYDIACVVPGSDSGIRFADKLNKALGLRGNDPETTDLRCTKAGMFEALGKAGIRRIESAVVTSAEQVRRFWNDNKLTKAVLKFSESSGTVGLKICDSLEDALEHFEHMHAMYNSRGSGDSPIMVQEFIGGTEYIVNSLSIDGKHKITDIWRYEKIVQPDGVLTYDTCILVDRLVPGMQDILEYCYQVLDAVDMKNGFSHNEFKVDEKGPVLIEVNARVMGGNLTREYLDEIFGSHMTDITLKALLEPTFFDDFLMTPYLPRKSAMFKFSIVPQDVKADLAPFFELVRHLESYREIIYFGKPGVQEYLRTIDLETSPFFIRLINEDYGKLKRDYELLRLMEERYFGMLFTVNNKVDGTVMKTDIAGIVSHLPLSRKFALIEDDRTTVIQYGKQTVTEEWEIYDGAIFAVCGASTLTQRFRQMMRCLNHIRRGGPVIIVPESYRNIPYGAVAAEVIMTVMGFNEEIPPSVSHGVIYGIKR